MRRVGGLGLLAAISLASIGVTMVPVSSDKGIAQTQQLVSKKSKKAAKRMRYAEGDARSYRSRNKPPKRKLHRNLVRHGRRVRRKHRRAA